MNEAKRWGIWGGVADVPEGSLEALADRQEALADQGAPRLMMVRFAAF